MSEHRVVLHVGMQQTGTGMLHKALRRLRPQLRGHGVALIDHGQIESLPHRHGWAARRGATHEGRLEFERRLRELVATELERTRAPQVLLVSSDHLLGAANPGTPDEERFRPRAEASIEQITSALEVERAELVLLVRRQDRLMEACYLREISNGAHHPLKKQFPRRFEPTLDYAGLLERLEAIEGVATVRVRPFELVGAGSRAFVDDFLGAVDLAGQLDLSLVPAELEPFHLLSRRGWLVAQAINPFLESDRERRVVRRFLMQQYGSADDAQTRVIPKRERPRILDAYREVNRELFEAFMPDLPADAYADDGETAKLEELLLPPGRGRSLRWSSRALAGRALRVARRLVPAS